MGNAEYDVVGVYGVGRYKIKKQGHKNLAFGIKWPSIWTPLFAIC